MKNIRIVRALAAVLGCALLSPAVRAQDTGAPVDASPAPRKPNILFILCDDLGYGEVGVFFQNQRKALNDPSVPSFSTPCLDAMAQGGVMLTRQYSGAPVCAPSRASILTGLTQGHAPVRNNQFDKGLTDILTLGSVLRQAGYRTAAIGKWGMQGGPLDKFKNKAKTVAEREAEYASWESYPTKRGFDYFYGYVRHMDGHFHYPKRDNREVWENDREVSAGLDGCYTTDLFTARAKQWIIDQTREHPAQPFFMYLAYDTPHAALVNPPCPYPAGAGLNGGLQWLGRPHDMINTARGKPDSYMFPDYADATWVPPGKTKPMPWPIIQKRYANIVRRIDFSVGDVLQLLRDLKIADNTLVVFTSDNGPSDESYLPQSFAPTFFHGFGPFDGIKRDTLEGGEREPTIVSWPGVIPAGRRDNAANGQWDWLPTFAQVAGLPEPAGSDGTSLMPLLTGRGTRAPETIYIEYAFDGRTPAYKAFAPAHRGLRRGQMQMIQIGQYTGLRYNIKSADDNFWIFDVDKDPQESTDLAAGPGFAALQKEMKARVLQMRLPDPSARRPYDNAPVPAEKSVPSGPAGLAWSLYDGAWPWMPDFRTLTPASTGIVAQVGLGMAPASGSFGVAFSGYIHVPRTGRYTFTTDGDCGTMLFVHDARVIDEPRVNPAGRHSGTLLLAEGWHPIRLYYRHAAGAPLRLEFTCTAKDGEAWTLGATDLKAGAGK